MDNERKLRLEVVLKEIERHKYSVDKLEAAILMEYRLEGGDSIIHKDHSYGWNLDITIGKQLNNYKNCKSKKYIGSYYTSFINAFKQDVTEELQRMEMIDKS